MFAGQGAAVSLRGVGSTEPEASRQGRFASFARLRRARGNRPSLFAALVCLLASCESMSHAPPAATSQMASAAKGQAVNLATLREGRTLFVHRCIECHTLPPVWHYSTGDWPDVVDSMAARASLKRAERDAIVAYILAARGQ